MDIRPKHNISAARALGLLTFGKPINDAYVGGEIYLSGESAWDKEVVISNCIVEYFDGCVTEFHQPVKFINTHFKDCRFISAMFLKGLIVENCTFDSYLSLESGGHNQSGYPVTIKNNKFEGFVNFADCWYMSDISVTDNTFLKGTNIGSQNQYLTFVVQPIIMNNIGRTDIEAEDAD